MESHETQRRLAVENAAMAEIGRIIASPLSMDGVYDRFEQAVQNLIPFDRITITSSANESESNVILYSRGTAVSNWAQGYAFPMRGNEFSSEIKANKRALAFNPTDRKELEERNPNLLELHRAGLRSFLGSPLMTNGQVIGSIFLGSATAGAYTDQDADLLQRIGNQVAGSIASGILLNEERDRVSQLEALYEVAAIIAQPMSFEATAQAIVETLVRIADADHADAVGIFLTEQRHRPRRACRGQIHELG
ncbi:MAG: GAF domain-containing protein [Planctomycetes bacterium]|nr:GAF domain-containing protein [Planctomycetota bacterium]